VAANPEYDTVDKLRPFARLFGGPSGASLIFLREESSKSPNLRKMLAAYKVPVGVNDEEAE